MSTIVTRSGKGSPLTNTEVDSNFQNLNTDKAELSGAAFTGAITTNSTIDGRDVAADGVTADAALPKSGGAMTGAITTNSTFDGVDIATRDAVLTSTTTTANAALPKAGGAMTGAITTNSTFDGRDVATDGTKLDGIEASATADQTGAQIKTAYEAETNAFTDAQFTKLGGIEASADVTDATNVTAAGALMDSELTSIVAVKALNQGVATGDSPDFAALNVNGTATMDGLVVDGDAQINGDASTDGLVIQNPLSGSFYNAKLEFMRDGTSGGAKIQTERASAGGVGLSVNVTSSNTAEVNGTYTKALNIAPNGDISFYEDTGTTAKLFWDASAESLGIGTSSAEGKLRLSGDGTLNGGLVLDSGAQRGYVYQNGTTLNTTVGSSARAFTWGQEGATADMTLTGGNFLVGTTDDAVGAGNTATGISLRGGTDNRSFFSAGANYAMHLNRNTSDGEILYFAKNGTAVGSIGNNTDFYIASQDGTGVRFSATQVLPCSESGATQNGSRDLGASNARFKDLYLSGGVYLGGTGAANKLDDYEEGTWTPVTGPTSTTATYAFRSGYYTKVGNLVTCTFGLKHNGGVWTSGEATISGLPFTVDTTGSYQEPQFIVTSVGLLPTGKGGSAAGGAFNTGEVSFYCSGTQGRGRSYVSNSDTVMGGNAVFATNSFIKATIIYHSS